MKVTERLRRIEAARGGVLPMAAMVITPSPGETNQEAKARTLAAHPAMSGAPTIILRLSREAPCEAN